MDKDRIQQIETLAKDILREAYEGDDIIPPIDIGKVIEKSGLSVKFGKFNDGSIDGAFDRTKKEIFIQETAPYVRQAFTAAHELGHFFLHQEKVAETFYRRDSLFVVQSEKEQEKEANWFAASLLMPKESIRRFWQALGDVDDVANRFGVSSTAAFWRLRNLGLI